MEVGMTRFGVVFFRITDGEEEDLGIGSLAADTLEQAEEEVRTLARPADANFVKITDEGFVARRIGLDL
jgi:hypothetical protein